MLDVLTSRAQGNLLRPCQFCRFHNLIPFRLQQCSIFHLLRLVQRQIGLYQAYQQEESRFVQPALAQTPDNVDLELDPPLGSRLH